MSRFPDGDRLMSSTIGGQNQQLRSQSMTLQHEQLPKPSPASSRIGLSARDLEILELRAAGLTLAEIGRRFGISRQRVAEIIRERGGPPAAEAIAARQARKAELLEQHSQEILERWRAGAAADEIARHLGLTVPAVKTVIDRAASSLDQAARARAISTRTSRLKYSDKDLIAGVLKAARKLGHTPSEPEYARLARDLGIPSVQTIIKRLGSWGQAARAAGLQPNPPTRRDHRKKWDEEACWRALESVADELGDPPRYHQYEKLSASRPDLPSGATVRKQLGSWIEVALELTARRAGEESPPGWRVAADNRTR